MQRVAQLAYAAAAAAAAAVKSERVCRSGHQPVIRRTQPAGQHEVGRLQGPSHGCSYRDREMASLLRQRCQASRDDITHSQITVYALRLQPAVANNAAAAAQGAKNKDG